MKKPPELDITVLATLGLDLPIKMLALAVEVTEASQREFIMAFDGGGDGTDRLGGAARVRDRPNGDGDPG